MCTSKRQIWDKLHCPRNQLEVVAAGPIFKTSQAKDSGLDYIRDDKLRPMVACEIQLLKKAESTQQSSPSSNIDSLNDQVPCDSDSRRLGYAENCTKALEDAN